MPEIFNPRNPPLDQLNRYALNLHPRSLSKSELRGEICDFIAERGEVTYRELLGCWEEIRENFCTHELELEEALTGLFDRQYLDYRQGPEGGTYFLNPDLPRKQPSAVRKRLYGRRMDGRRNYKKQAENDLDYCIRLFHRFRKVSLDPTISETERSVARNHMMNVWSVLPWGLASNILDWKE